MIKQLKNIGSIKLVFYFFKAYPTRSMLMVGCFLFSGLAEGVSFLTLVPMLDIIQSGGPSTGGWLGTFLKKLLDIYGIHPNLPIVLTIFVIGMIVKGLFMLVAMKQVGYTVAHVTSDLRLKLIKSLMNANWNYFISRPAGYFANAMSSEAMRASTAYHHTALFVASLINAFIYIVLAMILSLKTTIISASAAIIMIFAFSALIKKSRRAGFQQTELMKSIISRLTDALQGIKSIKAMAQENHFQDLLETETQDLYKAQKRQVFASEALKAMQEPFVAIMIAAIIYIIITFGKQSFSSLLVMLLIFNRLLSRIYTAQACYQEMAVGESALWSLLENIEEAEVEIDKHCENGKFPNLVSDISMNSVNLFHGKTQILKNVNMSIPAGKFVAIIGPSGAGKTTIVDLITGLFVPQSGDIYIDGVSLKELDIFTWRKMIGYVPQEIFMFHDSVFRNVSLGDNVITNEDVEEALISAGALDFVSKLPSGVHTVIGERGSRLSGGQRQRIAVARALLHKPKLLILDEATTALDPKTEAEICELLHQLCGRTTIIAISHQPAIAEVADLVYKIRNGCVEEEHSYDKTQLIQQ
jgi:ATP-binding cassette, subfamily C, bacterial